MAKGSRGCVEHLPVRSRSPVSSEASIGRETHIGTASWLRTPTSRDWRTATTESLLSSAIISVGLIVRVVIELECSTLVGLQVGEKVWDFTLALHENIDELLGDIFVAVVVERRGKALMSDASSATDAVDVLSNAAVHAGWEIEVDNVHNIFDVPTASRDTCSNKNGSTTSTEVAPMRSQVSIGNELQPSKVDLHGILTLTLVTIRMYRGRRKLTVVEKVVKQVDLSLGVAKDDGATGLHLEEQVEHSIALPVLVHPQNVLAYVLMGLAGATDADPDMIVRHPSDGQQHLPKQEDARDAYHWRERARASFLNVAENIIKVWSAFSLESDSRQSLHHIFQLLARLTASGHDLLQFLLPIGVQQLIRFIDYGMPVLCKQFTIHDEMGRRLT